MPSPGALCLLPLEMCIRDSCNIVQMAPPEEMRAHPASVQIQDFLGNFIDTHAQKELTAADFMRSGVSTVSARRGVNECVSKMQRRNVDTLIVVDDQDRYQGTVSIADIRLCLLYPSRCV